ncbi:MspA family porin [Nocardia sp. NPDC055321]
MFGTGKIVGGKAFGVLTGGLAVASLAVLCPVQPGRAHADTDIPLPGGSISRTLVDGSVVTVRLEEESARISPSMGSTPVHRNVWVSGRGVVDVSGPSAQKSTIKITPGYLVGCQVDIGTISGNNNGQGVDADGDPTTPMALAQSVGTGITFGPGQSVARMMLDLEQPDDYGNEIHYRRNKVPGPHASVTWFDETFDVNGCGGYAQARAFVVASVGTETQIGDVVLWGAPFSMG